MLRHILLQQKQNKHKMKKTEEKPQNHNSRQGEDTEPEGIKDAFAESSPSQTSGSGSLSDKKQSTLLLGAFYPEENVREFVKKLKDYIGPTNDDIIRKIDKIFGKALV